jgi:serine/threonine-protein kinase HipA
MPAYFENLVAEGWLRKVQAQAQRISEGDRFGLLLENGRDLVGAITVLPVKGDERE